MADSKNINININFSGLEKAFGQLTERLSRLTGNDMAFVILALILPPIAVLLKVGLTTQFWVNVILTMLGFVPGQVHALWVVLFLK